MTKLFKRFCRWIARPDTPIYEITMETGALSDYCCLRARCARSRWDDLKNRLLKFQLGEQYEDIDAHIAQIASRLEQRRKQTAAALPENVVALADAKRASRGRRMTKRNV